MVSEIPFFDQTSETQKALSSENQFKGFVGTEAARAVEPTLLKESSQFVEWLRKGKVAQRKPETFSDYFKVNFPFLREDVKKKK